MFDHIQKLLNLGVGEILINDVDNDGRMEGYDQELIYSASSVCSVPTIFCGGAASLQDLRCAVKNGANAVAAGSIFVYKGATNGILINYPSQVELHKLFVDQNKA